MWDFFLLGGEPNLTEDMCDLVAINPLLRFSGSYAWGEGVSLDVFDEAWLARPNWKEGAPGLLAINPLLSDSGSYSWGEGPFAMFALLHSLTPVPN